jgi:hypothetical protein
MDNIIKEISADIVKVQKVNRKLMNKMRKDVLINPDVNLIPYFSVNRLHLGIIIGLKKALKTVRKGAE